LGKRKEFLMTNLHDRPSQGRFKITVDHNGRERREHRRHDLESQRITVDRWDGSSTERNTLGEVMDISAGGLRIRTQDNKIRPDQQIRLRLELPAYAGICPFIDAQGQSLQAKRDWVGWMAVSRVAPVDDHRLDVAGRLVDMDDMDRGMLGLYLSTQPLAA
jgi:hypothetical protein